MRQLLRVKKHILSLALVMMASGSVLFAQKYLYEGNKYFDRNLFEEAIPFYLKEIEKGKRYTSRMQAMEKLADCYKHTGQFLEASEVHKNLLQKSIKANKPKYTLEYAHALKNSAQYEEAAEQFMAYKKLKPGDPMADVYLQSCFNAQAWIDEMGEYTVNNFSEVNSPQSEFAPVFYENGIAMTTARENSTRKFVNLSETIQVLRTDLYYKELNSDESAEPDNAHFSMLNTYLHEGSCTFSKEMDEIYFTRTVLGETDKKHNTVLNSLQVFHSRKNNMGEWSEPISAFDFNSQEYSVGQPCLTRDGKRIFYISDRDGGFGATDIYYSDLLRDGTWTEPINVGSSVNTFGYELFPYATSRDTLYFSSATLPGMGKLDIFMVVAKGDRWGEPVNLKSPINSIGDDFGITMDESGTYGFFSSDRFGGSGQDDIYTFYRNSPTRLILDGHTLKIPNLTLYHSISYKIQEEEGSSIALTDNGSGYYEFPLKEKKSYRITMRKNGFYHDAIDLRLLTNESLQAYSIMVSSGKSEMEVSGVLTNGLPAETITQMDTLDPETASGIIAGALSLKDVLPGVGVRLMQGNSTIENETTGEMGNFEFGTVLSPGESYLIAADPLDILAAREEKESEQVLADDPKSTAKEQSRTEEEDMNSSEATAEETREQFNEQEKLQQEFMAQQQDDAADQQQTDESSDRSAGQEYKQGSLGDQTHTVGQEYSQAYGQGDSHAADSRIGQFVGTGSGSHSSDPVNQFDEDASIGKHDYQGQTQDRQTGQDNLKEQSGEHGNSGGSGQYNSPGEYSGDELNNYTAQNTATGQNHVTDRQYNNQAQHNTTGQDNNTGGGGHGPSDHVGVSNASGAGIGTTRSQNTGNSISTGKPAETYDYKAVLKNSVDNRPVQDADVQLYSGQDYEDQTRTDQAGEFSFRLEKEKEYRVIAGKEGYFQADYNIAPGSDASTDGFVDQPMVAMEPIEVNRSIEMENILFDFNKFDLRRESMFELDRLTEFLNTNPGVKVMLNAHTDTRGNFYINLLLSHKRAASAKRYLILNGIDPERVKIMGYGESLPKIGSADSDWEHEANRRVEFRILDNSRINNGLLFSNQELSSDPSVFAIFADCPYTAHNRFSPDDRLPRGTYYRILLKESQTQLRHNAFDGVFPVVEQYNRSTGKYRYYAGIFSNRRDAQEAADVLTSYGFRPMEIPEAVYDTDPDNVDEKGFSSSTDYQLNNRELFFCVQVVASKRELRGNQYAEYEQLAGSHELNHYLNNGYHIYTIGRCGSRQEADRLKDQLVSRGADNKIFITAIHGKKRITVKEAEQLIKEIN